jgi:hypothetical protein
MKQMSKTAVFSEGECPHCEQWINYDKLYKRHYEYDIHEDNFEYHCPHCSKTILVKVEFTPSYSLTASNNV